MPPALQCSSSMESVGSLGGVGAGSKMNKITVDEHCYECKVHYRDPKSKDLIMYLHAWKYKVGFKLVIRKIKLKYYLFNRGLAGSTKLSCPTGPARIGTTWTRHEYTILLLNIF